MENMSDAQRQLASEQRLHDRTDKVPYTCASHFDAHVNFLSLYPPIHRFADAAKAQGPQDQRQKEIAKCLCVCKNQQHVYSHATIVSLLSIIIN